MSIASATNERPTHVRWTVFALGCATSWLLYLHRYTFALIKPKLEEEFGWTASEMGLLDSAFLFCYAVFQVPCGIVADVFGPHLFLAGIILFWSLTLGLHAWAPSLEWMRGIRGAFGIGQAGAYATLSQMTRTWFPLQIRTSVQGWMGVFFGRIGGASANLIFAWLLIGVLGMDWRMALWLFAGMGGLLGLLFLVLFRNNPRSHPGVNAAELRFIEGRSEGTDDVIPAPKPLSVAEMFRGMSARSILNVFALNLQASLSTIADNIYSSWIPLFLSQVHGLNYKEMGLYSTLPLFGGAIGGALGGYLNDAVFRGTGNRRWARAGVGMAGKGMAGVLMLTALWFYDQPYYFCVMLFFVKLFSDWSLASTWGTVTDIGGRTSATVYAFNNSVASGAGILAPAMFGYVADVYSWRAGFLIVAATYGVCAISWSGVNATIPVIKESTEPE